MRNTAASAQTTCDSIAARSGAGGALLNAGEPCREVAEQELQELAPVLVQVEMAAAEMPDFDRPRAQILPCAEERGRGLVVVHAAQRAHRHVERRLGAE